MGKLKNKFGVLALVGGIALGVTTVHANLVLNGGFESGLTDWTISFGGSASTTTSDPYSGSSAADLNTGPAISAGVPVDTGPIEIDQNVSLDPGTTYDLSFWLRNASIGDPATIQVGLDGVFGYAITNGPSSYTFYSFIVKPKVTPSDLLFLVTPGFDGNATDIHLDDVSLVAVPVPETGTMLAGALLLLPLCASTLKIVSNKSQKRLKMSPIGIDEKMSL